MIRGHKIFGNGTRIGRVTADQPEGAFYPDSENQMALRRGMKARLNNLYTCHRPLLTAISIRHDPISASSTMTIISTINPVLDFCGG
jgi:hypothetical protein